jgi:signal transduction histidine kinase
VKGSVRTGIVTALPLFLGVPAVTLSWALDDSVVHLLLETSLCVSLALALFAWSRRASARSEPSWDREIFDAVREPLLLVGGDGQILASNHAARQLLGGQISDDMPFRRLFHAGGKDVFSEVTQQIEDTGAAQVDAVILRAETTAFPAVIHGARVAHLNAPTLLIGVQDLAERRHADELFAQLSREVLEAQEEERTRISRDLHDGLGQIIAAAHFELGMTRTRLTHEAGVDEVEFARSTALIEDAGEKLRHICRGLRPPTLDDLGLVPAIVQLIEEVEEYSDLRIDLDERCDEDTDTIPPESALCVFRVLQEALTNVQRHAGADKVSVTLVREYQWLSLSVYDNGAGFDATDLDHAHGFGVKGMRERARLVLGSFELRSVPGQGTRVALKVPVPRKPEEDES